MTVIMRESIYENVLVSQARHFFVINGIPFSLKRTTGRQTMIIHSWVSGRYVLENKVILSL